MLFLLRLLLRKEWIAGAMFVAIITFATTSASTTPCVDYPLNALAFAIFAFALLRFGLLAAIVTSARGPDPGVWACRWIFPPGTPAWPSCPSSSSLLLAVYGFRVSLGGRKLLKQEL